MNSSARTPNIDFREKKKSVFMFRENPQLEAEKLHNDVVRRRLRHKSIGNIASAHR